jgi:hypothetical protein
LLTGKQWWVQVLSGCGASFKVDFPPRCWSGSLLWSMSNPQKKDLVICEKRRNQQSWQFAFGDFFATERSGSRVFTRGFYDANPHKYWVCGASKTPVSVLRTETGGRSGREEKSARILRPGSTRAIPDFFNRHRCRWLNRFAVFEKLSLSDGAKSEKAELAEKASRGREKTAKFPELRRRETKKDRSNQRVSKKSTRRIGSADNFPVFGADGEKNRTRKEGRSKGSTTPIRPHHEVTIKIITQEKNKKIHIYNIM